MKVAALLVSLCLLCNPCVVKADTYKWVDETGKVHLSDRVPPKYKDKAVLIGKTRTNTMGLKAANSAAEAVFRKKALAESKAKSKPAAKLRQSNARVLFSSSHNRDANSCTAKKAAYSESKSCFSGCRRKYKNGTVNIAACGHCENVSRPNC